MKLYNEKITLASHLVFKHFSSANQQPSILFFCRFCFCLMDVFRRDFKNPYIKSISERLMCEVEFWEVYF